MKKALVILMALTMVFAAFADEPAVMDTVAEFTGSASVTWSMDLGAGKSGFTSTEGAHFKFNIAGTGSKSTSDKGEAVWGELAIKFGDDPLRIADGAIAGGSASVTKAKLHISDNLAISIRDGDVTNGGYKLNLAAASDSGKFDVGAFGGDSAIKKGLTFEVAVPDTMNVNIDFRSTDGCTNKYGIAADFDIKAVAGLTLKFGYGMDIDFNDTSRLTYNNTQGAFAQLGYEIALADGMTAIPQVAYGSDLNGAGKLAAGVLISWGDKNKDPIHFMTGKVSNGFSVATMIDLTATRMVIPLGVAVYDSTFVENLCAGVELEVPSIADFSSGFDFNLDAKYDMGDIVPTFGIQLQKRAATSRLIPTNDVFKAFASVDYKAIPNTTITASYESGNLLKEEVVYNTRTGYSKKAAAELGKVSVTLKISL